MKTKILVVEDNEQNLYLVTYMLEKHGYEVIQARDGTEGIEMADRHHPDLVLMDIQLPGMDGLEVTKRLRSYSKLNTVPIVAVSSHAMAGDREKGIDAGCSGYIEKPINPDTFINEVEKYLIK